MKKKALEKKPLAQCNECDHLCCKYITLKIPAPRTIIDFDGLLWQVSHENVMAFKDSTGWHLLVYNSCVHLNGNGECLIYENRPITCREHSIEKCEYESSIPKTSLIFFNDFISLNKFCKKKFKTWNSRFLK